jgi:Uma2 family endonuclease
MTVLPELLTLSVEEYLARETEAEMRSEYWEGIVYAMPGGSYPHSLIIGNLWRIFWACLGDSSYEIHGSELRVKVTNRGYAYPDLMIATDEVELAFNGGIANLLNPALIIEVLSKSTEAFDEAQKFDHYKTIPTFSEYLLIAQESPRVQQFIRHADDQWQEIVHEGLSATFTLTSVPCTIPLAEIYRRIELE